MSLREGDFLAAGMLENAGDVLHDAHVPLFEMPFCNGGGAPVVAESTRLLAVQGCEIALFPFAADPAPGTAGARPVLSARCAEKGGVSVQLSREGRVCERGPEVSGWGDGGGATRGGDPRGGRWAAGGGVNGRAVADGARGA